MIKQSATYGEWKIDRHDDDKIEVYKNGELCASAASALREISQQVGFEENPNWNTRQFGSKLVKFLCENAPSATSEQSSESSPKDEPEPDSDEIDPLWYELPDNEYFDYQHKIRENKEQILNELKKGHEQGDLRSTMILAKLDGVGMAEGREKQIPLLLELAEKGNISAISSLAYYYGRGEYVDKNETLAIVCDICTDFLKRRKNHPDDSIWQILKWIEKINGADYNDDPEFASVFYNVMTLKKKYDENPQELWVELADEHEEIMAIIEDLGSKVQNEVETKIRREESWEKQKAALNYVDLNTKYKKLVAKYDNDIEEWRTKYNNLVNKYNNKIEENRLEYNKLVDEYNDLLHRKNSLQSKYESAQAENEELEDKLTHARSSSRSSADDIVKVRIMYLKKRTFGWNSREEKIVEMPRREYKQLSEGSMKNRIAYVNNKFKTSWNIDGLEEVHVELV